MTNPFERGPERVPEARCPHCGGTGKDSSGNKCKHCLGTGKANA